MSWPDLRLYQTENECGDGKNTWEYANYVFQLAHHYISNGVSGYAYWNMVLPGPDGRSTWGWTQNSMISVNMETREVIYNPEYYVMQILAASAEIGSVRAGLKGRYAAHALAFRSADRRRIRFSLHNPYPNKQEVTILLTQKCGYRLPLDAGEYASIDLPFE